MLKTKYLPLFIIVFVLPHFSVLANIEKIVFTHKLNGKGDNGGERRMINDGLLRLESCSTVAGDNTSPARLSPPYSIFHNQLLNLTAADHQSSVCAYELIGLIHSRSYEVKVSYLATTPTDFNLSLVTTPSNQIFVVVSGAATGIMRTFNNDHLDAASTLSSTSSLESTLFNIVLEELVFSVIPITAISGVGLQAIFVLGLAYFFIYPRVRRAADDVGKTE